MTMRMMTCGRFLVANQEEAERRGVAAALGYADTLADACEIAHTYGSSRHPVAVYDTEMRRTDYEIRSIRVHVTHGE